jgi:hypothetical protein
MFKVCVILSIILLSFLVLKMIKNKEYFDNKNSCYMGINEKQPLKDEYATIGCNLYDYYNQCEKNKKDGKCTVYNVDGTISAVKCEDGNKPNCLESPTQGFGCPGKDFTSDNIPPINPNNNKGVVCKYTEQ